MSKWYITVTYGNNEEVYFYPFSYFLDYIVRLLQVGR